MAKKKTAKKKNYINNKDLLAEVIKSKEQGKMTDKFGHMMMLLVKRYSSQGCYAGYTYIDDMESYALMTVCKVWNSFKPERSDNPFAYFTQTIKRAFWQYLHQEEKHRDIRDEMLMKEGELPSHTYVDKYEEKEFNVEFDKTIKEKSPTPTFQSFLRKLAAQIVGVEKSSHDENTKIIEEVCATIEEEVFEYELEKTTPVKFLSDRINELCAEVDPSYRVVSTKEYYEDNDNNVESYDDEKNYKDE